jgi:uncharacterized protein YmfQ (DUF2313 family)
MTNKPNTDKTIEQIKHDAADNYAKDLPSDSERFFTALAFSRGFDAAIQLCEQRERDLVEALEYYADPENYILRNIQEGEWTTIMPVSDKEIIRNYKHPETDWVGTINVCGKTARKALQDVEESENE